MERPEDNKVVTDALTKVIRHYPKMNTFIMDRNCKYFQTAQKTRSLNQITAYPVDLFHAQKGRSKSCQCNPYYRPSLMKRVKNVNTSAAEQVFSWFRGYAGSMNTMPRNRHYFFVLRYCRLHNALMDKGEKAHLPNILKAKKVK